MKQDHLQVYFEKYYSMCYRVAFTMVKNHADAEDIVQEVLVRLMIHQPRLAGEEHEKAWMIRTTLNLSKDLLKSKWHSSTVCMDEVPQMEREYFHIPVLDADDTLWTLFRLPERYRSCLYLFYYEDYSIREIADILEVPENTVKTNLRRGREMLRDLLQKEVMQ